MSDSPNQTQALTARNKPQNQFHHTTPIEDQFTAPANLSLKNNSLQETNSEAIV